MSFQANDNEDVSKVFTEAETDRAIVADDVLASDLSPVVPNLPTQAPPVVRRRPQRPNLFGNGGRPQKRPVRRPQAGFLASLGITRGKFPFLF